MKLEKIISAIALATMALILYMVQTTPTQQIIPNTYQGRSAVNLSGVPEEENFSEEIDTIFYDELGIKNVRFKQTF